MSYNPGVGTIITVRDFVDMVVYYLMQPEPDYTSKITIVCNDGFRMNIFKDKWVGQSPTYSFYNEGLQRGDGNQGDFSSWVYTDDTATNANVWHYHGYELRDNYGANWAGKVPRVYTKKADHSNIIKIIDPADNSIYGGINKHEVAGKMPVAGELISLYDIRNMLNANGKTMYKAVDVYIYDWTCVSWTNGGALPWYNPGGPGWTILNAWIYTRLDDPVNYTNSSTGLYDMVASNMQLTEKQYIASDQLQAITSSMYQNTIVKNSSAVQSYHVRSCHINCHHSCHCARW